MTNFATPLWRFNRLSMEIEHLRTCKCGTQYYINDIEITKCAKCLSPTESLRRRNLALSLMYIGRI